MVKAQEPLLALPFPSLTIRVQIDEHRNAPILLIDNPEVPIAFTWAADA